MSKVRKLNKENLFTFVATIVIIITLNILGNFYFTRFDLTAEGRYSLTSSTKDLIEEVEDVIFVKVYLDGDLPPDYKSLRNSTRELLDEFRAYNTNIEYQFIDPSESEVRKERLDLYQQLASKGLAYLNLPVENKDGYSQKTIFTSALLNYRGEEMAINLVETNRSIPDVNDINNSIQKLELKFASSIRKLIRDSVPRIAFTRGHGELGNYETASLASKLKESYVVSKVNIGNNINALNRRIAVDSNDNTVTKNKFDLILIVKPDSAFDDRSKFIIDQYIMNGGKVVWLTDFVNASMDSLQFKTTTLGYDQGIDLQTMLFKYGVRVNKHLVLNRNAVEIGTAEGQLRRWDFFPLALPVGNHIITKNITPIRTQFVNSIDLVGDKSIKKTVLLKTDEKSRIMPIPAVIDVVDIIYRTPNPALYNKEAKNLAVLLEGEFESIFANRPLSPEFEKNKILNIKYKSEKTNMLVIADGDIARNHVRTSQGNKIPLPLGYDMYSRKMFDNEKFLLNAINYMLNDEEQISLRNKEFKIRLLNKEKIVNNKTYWQILNTALPVLIIMLFGIILLFIRKRRNT
jgi:ABC-2 type transport system permease protein